MRHRWYLVIAALLFLGGIAIGLGAPAGDAGVLTGDLGSLEKFARFLEDLPPVGMLFFILAKNVAALLFSFALSPLLCIVPIVALVLNGALIGFVALPVSSATSVGYFLAAILPHGVIEIPALVIGEAAALSTGVAVMMVPFRTDARSELGGTLRRNLKYLGIAVGAAGAGGRHRDLRHAAFPALKTLVQDDPHRPARQEQGARGLVVPDRHRAAYPPFAPSRLMARCVLCDV